ncbi:MAG: squalene/phytoene synthase family protein [Zetaproteobacteria bacterium]|nr:MAG: squalene/phytoene synthase family protein [Zetaproteobacteria bacterium]
MAGAPEPTRTSVDTLPEPLPQILKRVSRSFALSLGVLPRSLRGPLGLAYLLARAADTVADTRILARVDRLRYLELLRGELDLPAPSRLAEIADAVTGPQRIAAERELLLRLPACFAAFAQLPPDDGARIRRVLGLLVEGMQADLRAFPGEDETDLAALDTRADLDRYTYYAAGCVGEFWTEMAMAHRPACRAWDPDAMRRRGARFGQALQMTNVLRDLAQDLRNGRCYVPRSDLASIGLSPADLLRPATMSRFRPLLEDLLASALDGYRDACEYTRAIPRGEIRLRLACAWPMLIGLRTLERIRLAEDLLDPALTVKIPRLDVYRILLRSGMTAWSDTGLARHYRALRLPLDGVVTRRARG